MKIVFSMKYAHYFHEIFPCAHPELVEGSARLILQQVQDERESECRKIIMCLLGLFFFHSTHPFSYDSVIYTAQNGDIKAADQQMRSIVVNSPDDADVLYDAGVLAHQLNNYNQAAAYFNRAAQCTSGQDRDLCFRAHFNAGNAYVENKDLKLALQHYDEALAIDPENEYARHNRERVTEMLNQQEQQKNNDQQDKQDQKDDKDDKNQQDKDKQDQNNQSDDKDDQQKSNDDQNQDGDDQQSNDSSKDGSDQKSKGKQGKGSNQDSKREHGTEQGDTDKDEQNSTNDKERNGEQQLDKKSERAQNEREKQQGKQHGKTPQEQDKTKSENSIPSDGKQEQDESEASSSALADASSDALAKDDVLDPWLQGILNDQELHDKAVNKKLMEARIRQHGGKNGQNCW